MTALIITVSAVIAISAMCSLFEAVLYSVQLAQQRREQVLEGRNSQTAAAAEKSETR